MTEFTVSSDCWRLGLRAGALRVSNIHITAASPELRRDIDAQAQRIRDEFQNQSQLRSLPEIARVSEVIRAVGAKPRSHPVSTQKLMEFAWRRGTLPSINNLVDTYNLMSLRTRCSLGAHDLNRLTTPVELRLFRGTETFRALGRDDADPIQTGEFGYVDAENRVICRLDSLQADFSKVTDETKNSLLIIESTDLQRSEYLTDVYAATKSAIEHYCGADVQIISIPGQSDGGA